MKRTYIKKEEKSSMKSAEIIIDSLKEGQLFLEDEEKSVIASIIEDGLTQLSLDIGRIVVSRYLENDVKLLCGEKSNRDQERQNYRHSWQQGYCYISGQKVPIIKQRVVTKEGREVKLPTYEKTKRKAIFNNSVMKKLMHGVSCRDYDKVIEHASERLGVSKSSVSRGFKAATRIEMEQLLNRRLDDEKWLVVFIDGKSVGGEMVIVAVGVNLEGNKRVLGFRQGSTENKSVVTSLINDLEERGLKSDEGILFVMDGSKALHSAVNSTFGERAFIQRCRVHKKRNVIDHIPKGQQPMVKQIIDSAYKETDIDKAREKLNSLAKKLEEFNPDAAGSLREGLEETLTVLKFELPRILTKSLMSTNPIESIFSTAETLMRRVKCWRGGDMRKRWVGAGMLRAESRCNRLHGYRYLGELARAMKYELEKKGLVKETEVA